MRSQTSCLDREDKAKKESKHEEAGEQEVNARYRLQGRGVVKVDAFLEAQG